MNFLENFNSLSNKEIFIDREGKVKQELWVVYKFLMTMGVDIEDSELKKISDLAPDIEYMGVEFEVKEILDEGRRRQDEIKDMDEEISFENSEWKPISTISLEELMGEVVDKVEDLHLKYAEDLKGNTNLIIYYDKHKYLRDFSDTKYEIENTCFESWKSVSMITDNLSCVLSANDTAPEYIKNNLYLILSSRKILI